jgi:hypothetical protein
MTPEERLNRAPPSFSGQARAERRKRQRQGITVVPVPIPLAVVIPNLIAEGLLAEKDMDDPAAQWAALANSYMRRRRVLNDTRPVLFSPRDEMGSYIWNEHQKEKTPAEREAEEREKEDRLRKLREGADLSYLSHLTPTPQRRAPSLGCSPVLR